VCNSVWHGNNGTGNNGTGNIGTGNKGTNGKVGKNGTFLILRFGVWGWMFRIGGLGLGMRV